MEHFPAGARPAEPGPADWFTGEVRIEPVVAAPAPARLRAALVSFAPGARTNWHTHPLGQTLRILSGRGLACREGGAPVQLKPGDTVWFAPGERHWHGAAPDEGMTHLAMQEAEDGVTVAWEEPVGEADYAGG